MIKNKESVIESLVEGNYVRLSYGESVYTGIFKDIVEEDDDESIILKAINSPSMLSFKIPLISDIEIIPKMGEKCNVIFRNHDGQELNLEIINSEEKGTLDINITGNPQNIKSHKGFHVILSNILIQALSE